MQLTALIHHGTKELLGYRFIDAEYEKAGDIDLDAIKKYDILYSNCTDTKELYPYNNGMLLTQEEINSGVHYTDMSENEEFIKHIQHTLRYRCPFGVRQGLFVSQIVEHLMTLLLDRTDTRLCPQIMKSDKLNVFEVQLNSLRDGDYKDDLMKVCDKISTLTKGTVSIEILKNNGKVALFRVTFDSDFDVLVLDQPLEKYIKLLKPSEYEQRLINQLTTISLIKKQCLSNQIQMGYGSTQGLALIRALEILNKHLSFKESFVARTQTYGYTAEPYYSHGNSGLTCGVKYSGMFPLEAQEEIKQGLFYSFDDKERYIRTVDNAKLQVITDMTVK